MVLIGTITDCRIPACCGADSSHNVSDLLQLNSKWGTLRCTYCSCKISQALTGLHRAAESSMNGKLVVPQLPVLKVVWVNSVPRKHPSAPFRGAAGFERVLWKFVP